MFFFVLFFPQLLEELKILNLSHSHYLTETPEFSMIPRLEMLILKDCPQLFAVHYSIGDLKCIVLLNLKDCKSLENLPRSVYNLKSLKTLDISGCSKIEKLEEDIGQMESLTTLLANQTAIAKVPYSLVRLKRVKHVSLCGYEGLPRDVFPSLVWSWMSPTHRSRSLFGASQILPSLIRGLSDPLFSSRYAMSEAGPSTYQASCQNTPAVLEYHDQVHKEGLETDEFFDCSSMAGQQDYGYPSKECFKGVSHHLNSLQHILNFNTTRNIVLSLLLKDRKSVV